MTNIARRQCLKTLAVAAATPLASLPLAACASAGGERLAECLAELERRSGGRLGVAVFDAGSGRLAGHRVDERFALCSTFKLPLAAAVLQRVGRGEWSPERWVPFGAADRVPHMPVTGRHIAAGGMRLIDLVEAAQTESDNLAANLLLRLLGGPAGFTAWLRTQGDALTRLDRTEPALNHVPPGSLADTTTPAAMARTVARQFSADGLDAASQARLRGWMQATRTGGRRLRAGLPPGWRSGDKTGTGLHDDLPDQLNDVAVVWPDGGRAPWLVAAYFESHHRGSPAPRAEDEAVLAEVGRLATEWLAAGPANGPRPALLA